LAIIHFGVPFGWAQPVADFSASNREGCGSLEVIFSNQSTGTDANTKYLWDLSGVSSDRPNPGRIFETPGKYTICLTATNANGSSNRICKTEFIVVYALPRVDFTLDRTKGCAPLDVNFTNLSKADNPIKELTWDVGGSANVITTATLDSTINSEYSLRGKYSVSLTVVDDKNCSNTFLKKDLIEVLSPPEVILTKNFLPTCGFPWIVQLKNNNIENGVIYEWDFGNGQTFVGPQPGDIAYSEVGDYTIKVKASQGQCVDTYTFEGFVNTSQRASIDVDKTTACTGEVVKFEDNTPLGADSVKWVLSDGTIAKTKILNHSFNAGGCQSVALYRFRAGCIDSMIINCFEVKEKPAFNYDIQNQYSCKIPVNISLNSAGDGDFKWVFYNRNKIDTLRGTNISYQIDALGNYTADLFFTSRNGCIYEEKSIPITIEKFDVNLPSLGPGGCVGSTILLSDSITSKLPIVSWKWEVFTDPKQTFDVSRPSIRLDKEGTYDVKLTVTNSIGCVDTVIRKNFLRIGTLPTIDFTADPIEDCLETERNFFDLSSANVNDWFWNFGDSTYSFAQNPMHTYANIGSYDVTLTVSHNGCGRVIEKKDFIKILEPVSGFTIEVDCEDPTHVNLKNNSTGSDILRWVIELSPTQSDTILDSLIGNYIFPAFGSYPISLYGKNFTTGCEHTIHDTLVLDLPKAIYRPDTLFGCNPLTVTYFNESVNTDSLFIYHNGNLIKDSIIRYEEPGLFDGPIFVAQDVNKCRDTFQLKEIIKVNGISAQALFDPIVCAPNSLEINDISRDTFATIISRTWIVNKDTSQETTFNPFFSDAGLFDVFLAVADSWGCTDTLLLPKSIESVKVDPGFRADSLGCTFTDIRYIPSGNNVNTSAYLWDFGDGSTSTDQVANHQYSVEDSFTVCLSLFDARGCDNTICKENYIDIKDPKASFTADPIASPCPPLITNFTNMSVNGTTYEWDFGDNSGISRNINPSHVYSDPDTFSVQLIAIRSNICADTFTIRDLIRLEGPRAEIQYEIVGNCLPLTINMSAQSDKPYNYFWDFGNGDIDTSSTIVDIDSVSYTFVETGKYQPKLIVQDEKGCKRIFAAEEIAVNEIKTDFTIQADSICGTTLPVFIENNSTSTASITQFEWRITGPGGLITDFSENISFNVDRTGSYDVFLLAEAEHCKDSLVVPGFYTIFPIPEAQFTKDITTLCIENSSTFTNTTAISTGTINQINWTIQDSTFGSSDVLMHHFTDPGLYKISLQVLSDGGCKDTITENVEILDGIKLSLPNDTIICLQDHLSFGATISTPERVSDFSWILPDGSICQGCDTISLVGQFNSVFQFIAHTLEGCRYQDSLLIQVAPVVSPQIALIKDDTICANTPQVLALANKLPDWKTSWFDSDILLCENCDSISINLQGSSSFQVLVVNQYGCISDTSIEIAVESSIPDFLVETRGICEGNSTVLSINGAVFNPVWSDETGVLCANCDSINTSPMDDHFIFLDVVSNEGCAYRDTVEVIVIPISATNAGPDTLVCKGELVTLNGSGQGQVQWSPFEVFFTPTKLSTDLYAHTPGMYTLTTTFDECVLKDSVFIDVIAALDLTVKGDTVCYNEEASLSVSGNAAEYIWYKNNKVFSNDSLITFDANADDVYYVMGSRKGCANLEITPDLMVHPQIMYELEERSYLLDLNSKTQVNANFDPNQNNKIEWENSPGLDCYDCPEPYLYGIDSFSTFMVTIQNMDNLCFINDSLQVRVSNACSDAGFYRPNIISASAGGANAAFAITPLDEAEFLELRIYDRWGDQVFVSEDVNRPWNGLVKGTLGQPGVYVYIVKAFCPETDKAYYFTGDVTLVK